MSWMRVSIALFALALAFEGVRAEGPSRGGARAVRTVAAGQAVLRPEPPVAARRPVRLVRHGIERVDPYAWLRDPNWRGVMEDPDRLAPEIRAHIEAENAYADAALAPLSALRGRLFEEMKGRMKQDESYVPTPDGPYAYWQKYLPGAEHPRIVRAPRNGGAEELLLDIAALAAGKDYFSLGQHQHSPDHRLLAYAIDETGSEKLTLRIRDIGSGRDLPDVIEDTAGFAWASDSRTLLYIRLDAELRSRFVYRHVLGTDPKDDVLVYEEPDLSFTVSIEETRSRRFLIISTGHLETSEAWLIDAARPQDKPVLVAARQPGLRYYVEDWGDDLVLRTNADGADDFKIVTAPAAAPGRENWRDLVPHQEGRRILSIASFAGHLARLEREHGLSRIVIRRRSDGAEHTLAFDEEVYTLSLSTGYEFDTRSLRVLYASPTTPWRVFDYDMETRDRVLRKEQEVPSGHDPAAYVVRRLAASAPDGERVPVTVLHRKGLKLDGAAPLFLEGYGAYASEFPTEFNANILSLVDRGFVYAIAHVRGGIEKGERWRRGGLRETKPNSFTDFIAVAEHLARERYTSPGRIVGRGESAGGMLMGAVANLRPELFLGIIARVPFVDVLNTMLDEELPLTASDVPEWGDPIRDPSAYRTIAGYSPYDNVRRQAYPPMLVTASITDSRVTYWEPAKWVARLRATKTDGNRILLVTRMTGGHSGATGRFEALEEEAMMLAFALDLAGLAEASPTPNPE